MTEWKEHKLGEITDWFSGGTPSKEKKEYWSGSIPWISAKTMTDYKVSSSELNITEEGLSNGSRLALENDILLLVRGSGLFIDIPINLVEKHVAFNQDIKAIRAKNSEHQDFIFFWLHGNKKGLNDILEETGIGAGKFDTDLLKKLEISIPTNDFEFDFIVETARVIFDKIDLLLRQNATLEKMAETLFRQWLVEEAKVDWEMGKITDYALHFKDSIHPQKNQTTFYSHYSIPAFDNGKNPVKELGQEIQSNKYKVPEYCILFSKLNPHKDKRVWLLQNEVEPNAICSTEFQVVLPKSKRHLYFLYGWLTLNENYNEIASGAGGTSGSHQRIDPNTIYDFQCPLVLDDFIENLNTQIEPLFQKQLINQTQIRTLTALRDTLLPKLMGGEVRIEI